MTLARRLVAEALGTTMLLATVVGSGIMGARLADGSLALTLLPNTLATGAVLVALLLALGPISGGHLNPAVTLSLAVERRLPGREAAAYVAVQVGGAVAGVALAHLMFAEPVLALSQHPRPGAAQRLSEFVATFGLVAVVRACAAHRTGAAPFAVGAWITAAYWCTASTSFANPAVTLARALTDTFTGIRPADVPGFVAAQLLGAGAATALFRWLFAAVPAVTLTVDGERLAAPSAS
jgi:glycerol uptake facilitator-like aquaporin